ncbi:MAG: hypothetical protein ACP5JG_16315, partial [Anaerolineae bacterium]
MIGFIIVSRLLSFQLDVYGEQHMMQASVILDFTGDLFPYHLFAITAVVVLTVATLAAWLLSGWGSRLLRVGAVILLVVCLVFGAIFFGLGRRSPVTTVPSVVTPTPDL